MEERLINLVKKFNSQTIEDNRDKIRNKIWKEIEELRKDDEFFREIESEERDFFLNLVKCHGSKITKIEKLFKLYESLEMLKYDTERFKSLVE